MKKFILSLIFGACALFSMSSCVTSAYGQDVIISETDGDIDIDVVIRYGTPYYFEGSLLYYIYNGWYYYPYYHMNDVYFYRYNRPFRVYHGYRFVPQPSHRPVFHDRGGAHRRNYRGFGRKDEFRPNKVEKRPSFSNRKSSTYQTAPRNVDKTRPIGENRPNVSSPKPSNRGFGSNPSATNRPSTISRPATTNRPSTVSRPSVQSRPSAPSGGRVSPSPSRSSSAPSRAPSGGGRGFGGRR